MKAAIACEGDQVSGHFGRCEVFLIVEVVDGKVVSEERVANPGTGHGQIPVWLASQGVEWAISGGMGEPMKDGLLEQGVYPLTGVRGSLALVVSRLAGGEVRALAAGPIALSGAGAAGCSDCGADAERCGCDGVDLERKRN